MIVIEAVADTVTIAVLEGLLVHREEEEMIVIKDSSVVMEATNEMITELIMEVEIDITVPAEIVEAKGIEI